MAKRVSSHSSSCRVSIGDTELEVSYRYEAAEPQERDGGVGNVVYPGCSEGVTIEGVYAVDAKVVELRRALVALLARPNEARAIDRAAQVVAETEGYAGPELCDGVTSALTDELAEQCLVDAHASAADAEEREGELQMERLADRRHSRDDEAA